VSGPSSDPPRPGVPLLPLDWPELAPLLDAVLDSAPEHRAALVLKLSAGDSARQRTLMHLLAECERDMPLLNRVAAERFDDLASEGPDCLLPELLVDRYQVGRELGRGGMARVYLARDLKHGRDVAIKVLRPELAASLGHDRFLREIEVAARLNHPNIVPLYDSGETSGSLYFVMPYEEGPSLRGRLARDGALPVSDALNLLRDVARALAYAHEHGVVHRDIKPDNVMFAGGAAVVTDFGIAKAVSAALTDVAGPTLTQSGSVIGTPAYMAPEQATGDPSTDHRADIYSFGCLAYELFTGNPPFHDESVHLVIAAHLATVPRVVTDLRTEVPPAVAELIARCLEKNPAARPQSARELLDPLDGATTRVSPTASPAEAVVRRPARALRWVGLALAVGVVGTVAYLATRAPGASAPITLTVLPFGNIGADSAMDLVAGGLAEEVASALQRVPGIQIKSRSGARAYRGKLGVDVTEAGARLKADYVMTGVIRQDRGSWILSADVERAADATSLWGDAFNVSPDRQAGTSEAIAAAVVAALRSRFPASIGSAPVLRPNQRTVNNEAYRLYLRGQEKLKRRSQSVKEAVELFRAAIGEDSRYAPAWSGLSMALAILPNYHNVPAREVRQDLVSAARRALELDSTLAQPHVALGMAYGFDYQWDSAATEFQAAMRLDGGDVEAIMQYARNLRNRGRVADAIRVLRAARTEDPASASVLSQGSYLFYLDHQLDSALVESRRALENDSNNMPSIGNGALVMLAIKRPDSARALADRALPVFSIKEYLIAKSGDLATARQGLEKLDAQRPQPWMAETRRAYTYLGLGDTAKALSAMERALDAKEDWPGPFAVVDPMFDPVRKSARFREILRRIGLAP
jgi:TolB-like protein/tetratricopeptide (TPR) repeat protein